MHSILDRSSYLNIRRSLHFSSANRRGFDGRLTTSLFSHQWIARSRHSPRIFKKNEKCRSLLLYQGEDIEEVVSDFEEEEAADDVDWGADIEDLDQLLQDFQLLQDQMNLAL